MRSLATPRDTLGNVDNAISKYGCAFAIEGDLIRKARLANAIAHLYVQVGKQNDLAVQYIEKSLNIQQGFAISGEESAVLLVDTMILYGNAMASEQSFTNAVCWYESALDSNPDKSPVHPSNLRAWYNKGVALFRSGDIVRAGHTFGIILGEAGKKSTVPPGTALVLNAIGSIYFANGDYAGAINRFKESLTLKNDRLSPCQRAGILCNTAIAYYKIGNYEESEDFFDQALVVSGSAGGISKGTDASIRTKFTYIL